MQRRPRFAPTAPIAALARPVALTRAGMALERGLRAFWPALSLLALAFAATAFRLPALLPPGGGRIAAGVFALALIAALGAGLWRFRWPKRAEAIARLDATLPGRPLTALTDAMALGQTDPASAALWQAHLARSARAAAGARPVPPAPDLAPRDPFALRIAALSAAVMALIFGAPLALFEPGAHPGTPGGAEAAMGPSWEGWAEPPRYTGKPGLYLNKLEHDAVTLPEGTRFSFRFYGAPVPFEESVSNPAAAPEAVADPQRRDFEAVRSGRIHLGGTGGRDFIVTLLPDEAPSVVLVGQAERRADGKLSQPFHALDDYAVTAGEARITLDLPAVDRRYGLSVAPEPRPDLVYDLPMPISGSRADFSEALVEDAAEHPWANLPVTLSLSVTDGRGQMGDTGMQHLVLPGRRFFDPRAAALIEARRDLLWSRENGPRTAEILRAITNRPEGLFPKADMAPTLRLAARRVEVPGLTPGVRDEVAAMLWQMAELLEDGGLSDALAAMEQAQQRLSEAMRNGASKDEISKLMQELKEATDNYLKMLAERDAQKEQGPQFGQQGPSQQITGDQIQQMMDAIQKLMEEGRMAEAQELLDQLARMMQNLKVTQGQGGQGDGPGSQSMKDLSETLREQQKLSDDAFRQMQQPPGAGQDGMGNEARPDGQGAEDGGGQGLADRQRALRRELDRQRGLMPRLGGEAGDAARQRLEEAGRSMDRAEQALRQGETGTALDRQADAIEALREGMRNLGQAMAEEQGRGTPGQGAEGEQRMGDATGGNGARELPRDPLGRATGEGGRITSNQDLLSGEDVRRRAQDLLDEIRRRSGERLRPEDERDYLKRLLDRF
ncbi:hypothetical protein SDC9_16982 [bioreactor metagenome]|uniref:TIGR02302 family protein n=1 Tax=bioreactor metagenome TaxID=1076179 RepID=A0A644TX56_9ZZZZ